MSSRSQSADPASAAAPSPRHGVEGGAAIVDRHCVDGRDPRRGSDAVWSPTRSIPSCASTALGAPTVAHAHGRASHPMQGSCVRSLSWSKLLRPERGEEQPDHITRDGPILVTGAESNVREWKLCLLPTEHAAAAVFVRAPPFVRDELRQRRPGGVPFEPPRLLVEPPDRVEPLVVAELGLASPRSSAPRSSRRRPWSARERMAVLAAMGEREARRVGEAAGRAVDDLRHHARASAPCGRRRRAPAAVRRNRAGRCRPPPRGRRAGGAGSRPSGGRRDGPA